MKEPDFKEVCTNCKYFSRYYVLMPNLRFYPTSEGFCLHVKTNSQIAKNTVRKNEGCDLWQSEELLKLERQYKTEILLNEMLKRIEELLAVVRDAK